MKDGRTVSDECQKFTGSAGNPMTREQRLAKVWDCIGRVLAHEDGEGMLALVEDLEEVPDISTLMVILGQKPPPLG